MHKMTKLFVLTALSAIASSHHGFASMYPKGTTDSNSSTSQTGGSSYFYQSAPPSHDMDAEHTFINASHAREQDWREQNRGMIMEDQRMMREGYDPNEHYPPISPGAPHPSSQGNGQMMHDRDSYTHLAAMEQEWHPSQENSNMHPTLKGSSNMSDPSMQGSSNEQHPVYEFVWRDGKWQNVPQNSQSNYQMDSKRASPMQEGNKASDTRLGMGDPEDDTQHATPAPMSGANPRPSSSNQTQNHSSPWKGQRSSLAENEEQTYGYARRHERRQNRRQDDDSEGSDSNTHLQSRIRTVEITSQR